MGQDIATRISEIENILREEFHVMVPGTAISRILMSTSLCEKEGVPVLTNGKSQLVWSVALGGLSAPKAFFHGNSIEEALSKAEAGLARQRQKERAK